jgi:F0F1-type ATP synthase assembly protein I
LPPPSAPLRFARYSALAFEFSGTIAAGTFTGWLIDRWFDCAPWGVAGGTVVGAVGGFIHLIEVLRRFERMDRDPQP